LTWKCNYSTKFKPPRPFSKECTGKNHDGQPLAAEAKELLKVTYLKALRDAYQDMQSGRHSRLSQVVQCIPSLKDGKNEYTVGMKLEELSLIGITDLSNKLLAGHPALKQVNQNMTDMLNQQMLLNNDKLITNLEVTDANSNDTKKLTALLEKLDLTVNSDKKAMHGKVGLGTSNILSMACELLLYEDAENENRSSFLIIEEPEAHIHAQRQLKLIQSFEAETKKMEQHQIIITTHSPLLASVVKLGNIVIVKDSKTFSLADKYTKLEAEDYKFLEKYLDATKANMFFARSVIIVEGPGEVLLLPTVAKLLGRSFTDYGTSLVDVRSTGLRRYAKIFQRKDETNLLNLKVACVTDRDIMPDCATSICFDGKYADEQNWPKNRKWHLEKEFTDKTAKEHLKNIKDKASGQSVETFISNHWTLEYDIAFAAMDDDTMRNLLIETLVKVGYDKKNFAEKVKEISETLANFSKKEEKASYFYNFFMNKTVSKADFAQELSVALEDKYTDKADDFKKVLPPYLVEAIKYVTEGE